MPPNPFVIILNICTEPYNLQRAFPQVITFDPHNNQEKPVQQVLTILTWYMRNQGSQALCALPDVMRWVKKELGPEPKSYDEGYSTVQHPVVSHISTNAGAPMKVTEQNQIVYRTSNLSD